MHSLKQVFKDLFLNVNNIQVIIIWIEGCQSTGSTIVLFTFKQVLCPLECMNMYLLVLNLREITMGALGVCTCYSYDIIIQY